MFITIAGELGSGKSTICKLLKEHHGYEIFSTGSIHRRFAEEKALSTIELNRLLTDTNEFDNYIDNSVAEFARANAGKRIIFDSRMAWHFVPVSLKVYLIINPAVAAGRVYATRKTSVESYPSVAAARADLIGRKKLEDDRFKRLYNADCGDYRNYDLVIDSTLAAPDEIVGLITDNGQWTTDNKGMSEKNNNCQLSTVNCQLYVSPANILPSPRKLAGNPSPLPVTRGSNGRLYTGYYDSVLTARNNGGTLIKCTMRK